MADVHDPATRSRNMAAVRDRDTRPELILRKGLHSMGFRFRLQRRDLPGRPDLVLPKYRAVIFAQGCFWHLHDCELFRWPGTREAFWRTKLAGNQARDLRQQSALLALGWRVALVWECALKGRGRSAPAEVLAQLAEWLRSERPRLDVRGQG